MIEDNSPQAQSLNSTDVPQDATANIGASDASPFQQAANADVLKQNTTIQVASNGNPITGGNTYVAPSSAPLILLAATFIVLGLITAYLLRAFKVSKPKKPEIIEKPTQKVAKETIAAHPKPKTKAKPKAKTKKVSRSKRRKN